MTDPASPPGTPRRAIVSAGSQPFLARGVKLQRDEARDKWILNAPERVLSPDPIAVEVLKLCDGNRSVADLAETMASRYDAPKEQIVEDITSMLQDLADKGLVGCRNAN
ncbi:MAG TPA: pyrroloquinoline quinone biosynthesis peptide chaperone PqqD [Hyphomicrobiaceae bacterium]|nr:pyrroloquinoline quinone biosynthesis peptide chaperone PqqD [Hyphomicrobiaceae bacterium]